MNNLMCDTLLKNFYKSLIAKLSSGFYFRTFYCKTNFWFCLFLLLSGLFFLIFKPIIIKNAWIFGYTKYSLQKVFAKVTSGNKVFNYDVFHSYSPAWLLFY